MVHFSLGSFGACRRSASVLGAALLLVGSATSAWSQTAYPQRTVRLIVGFPAGTGPDTVARLLAQKLSESWNNIGVVVDNKPGAGGTIAASEAARATPDGYTLMLGETGQLSIAPKTYNKLPYDPARDFAPVSQVVSSDFVLLVNPQKVPVKSVKEFATWSQQNKSLFMATFGAGTPGHFGAFMLGDAIKSTTDVVHYRSTADALGGLFGGDVHGVFASVALAAPNVKAGKLLALGSTGASRTQALPDVPTIKEQGYNQLEFSSWFGVVAPSKVPVDVLAKLSEDIQKITKAPDTRVKLEELGFRVTGTGREEFARIIASDTASWGKVVASTGFKAD